MLTAAEILSVRRHAGYPATPGADDPVAAAVAALSTEAETTLRTLYLPALDRLEAGILNSGELAGTKQAAVWHRNPAELAERTLLYRAMRLALCSFFGIPPGAGIDLMVIVAPGTDTGEGPGTVIEYPPEIFVV